MGSLSAIAAENCAQTFSFSFGNGRQFPATTVGPLAIQPRVNTNLLTAAFNDDLTIAWKFSLRSAHFRIWATAKVSFAQPRLYSLMSKKV